MLGGRLWALAGGLALAVSLVACGGGGGGSAQSDKSAADAAKAVHRGGTLLIALGNNPNNFDPMLSNDSASGEMVSNVFEGLYKYDADLKPQPWLAEKIDISADGLTYTFTMRKGVKFHDGTEMDADAVKFSMDRIRNNPKSVGYADTAQIGDTKVVEKYVFQMLLKEPFAPIPSRLTGRVGAVVSPTAVKTMGDEKFNLNPVGTGPFKWGEWKQDSYVRVEKFDGYWRQGADGKALPYVDRIEWRIITEASARLTALQSGDVHLSAVRDADLAIVQKDANLVFKQQPGRGFQGLWLTTSRPPFDNKALRQALAFAIDREEVNKVIYEGNRPLSNGPIPPVFAWAVDSTYKPYTYSPEKAKQKLAEGGKPTGYEFDFWISSGDSLTQQLAELYQAQLAKVGIKVNIQAGDFNGVVIPKLQKAESNAYALGLTGSLDPDGSVSSAWFTGGSFNFFPYSNTQVDDLIKKGRATSNLEERAKIYKDVVKLIMDDAPYIFVTHSLDRHVGNKKVQNWFIGTKYTTGYSEYWLSE